MRHANMVQTGDVSRVEVLRFLIYFVGGANRHILPSLETVLFISSLQNTISSEVGTFNFHFKDKENL